MFPYESRIINWYWMNGSGYTKEEAYKNLKEKFQKYKLEGNELPRPGSKVPIKFASTERIYNFDTEAAQFFKAVFAMDYYNIFISDESSMYDFCWDDILIEKQKIIQRLYGIDINDFEGLKIVDILERIKGKKGGIA